MLGETRALLLHGLTAAGKPMRDHLDIKGHNEAVLWLEDFVRDERPLTEQFIRGMHEVLLGEAYDTPARTPDGQPTRKHITPGQDKSGPNNVLTATGEMYYFATPEETPARMTDLMDWYCEEAARPKLHPVELAARFHYRFVCIHPFDDGNGRMSRLLMNLILLRHGYPMTVIKNDDRNRYLAALAAADAGEFEPFLRFVIENVEAALRLMIRAARGESVDEPEDLDKKLALLKKQLASREDFTKATWNLETQRRFYEEILKSWVTHSYSIMRKFNDLFFQATTAIDVRDDTSRLINRAENTSLAEFLFTIEEAVKGDSLLGEIQITFSWLDFRNVSTPFNMGLQLNWKFDKFKYRTQFSPNQGNFSHQSETSYFQVHNPEAAKEKIQQLAEDMYDFIAAKLVEAGSAPG